MKTTVMTRWAEAKKTVLEEGLRISECVNEAKKIIKSQCGQCYNYFGNGVTYFADSNGLVEVLAAGHWVKAHSSLEPLTAEDHWYVPLSAVEGAVLILQGITTGTLIAQWEKEQK